MIFFHLWVHDSTLVHYLHRNLMYNHGPSWHNIWLYRTDFLTLWVHESTWGVIKTTDCYTSVESWTQVAQEWKKFLPIGEIFFLFWVHESSWGTLFYTLCRILDPCFKIASPLGYDFFICGSMIVHYVYNCTSCTSVSYTHLTLPTN